MCGQPTSAAGRWQDREENPGSPPARGRPGPPDNRPGVEYAGGARRGFHTLLAPRVPQRAVAERRKTGFRGAGRDSVRHGAWRGEKPRDIVSSGGAQGIGRRLRPQCRGRGGPVCCFRVALSGGELCRWCGQAYSGPVTPGISRSLCVSCTSLTGWVLCPCSASLRRAGPSGAGLVAQGARWPSGEGPLASSPNPRSAFQILLCRGRCCLLGTRLGLGVLAVGTPCPHWPSFLEGGVFLGGNERKTRRQPGEPRQPSRVPRGLVRPRGPRGVWKSRSLAAAAPLTPGARDRDLGTGGRVPQLRSLLGRSVRTQAAGPCGAPAQAQAARGVRGSAEFRAGLPE